MARPKISETAARSERITIRLTKAELETLKISATTAGIKLTSLVRLKLLVLGQLNIRVSSSVDKEAIKQIIRIGQNINQVQKALNELNYLGHPDDLADLRVRLIASLKELYEIRQLIK